MLACVVVNLLDNNGWYDLNIVGFLVAEEK